MKTELVGKTIKDIDVIQPKCLNITPEDFLNALTESRIEDVTYRGKWILVNTTKGWLMLCLGMGGEILLVNRETIPEKHRVIFTFSDQACLSINFWWFGYCHYADQLENHKMTARLGPNAIDLEPLSLRKMLRGRRGGLKTFLLDQNKIAGIGNFYIHDILFLSRLHPMRTISDLQDAEIDSLAMAIHSRMKLSIDKGGFYHELDLYGKHGGFSMEDLIIGYKENQPCPSCSTPIQKIKTGSTHSFICPNCQTINT